MEDFLNFILTALLLGAPLYYLFATEQGQTVTQFFETVFADDIALLISSILGDKEVRDNLNSLTEPVLEKSMAAAFPVGITAASKDRETCDKLANLVLPPEAGLKFEKVIANGLSSRTARGGLQKLIMEEFGVNDPKATHENLQIYIQDSIQVWKESGAALIPVLHRERNLALARGNSSRGDPENAGNDNFARDSRSLNSPNVITAGTVSQQNQLTEFQFGDSISDLVLEVLISRAFHEDLTRGLITATQEGIRLGLANAEHVDLKEQIFEALADDTFASAGLKGSMDQIKVAVKELVSDAELKERVHKMLIDTVKDEGVHKSIFKGVVDAVRPRFPFGGR